jgi:hypothetical protein
MNGFYKLLNMHTIPTYDAVYTYQEVRQRQLTGHLLGYLVAPVGYKLTVSPVLIRDELCGFVTDLSTETQSYVIRLFKYVYKTIYGYDA